jgi:hypothetical protein
MLAKKTEETCSLEISLDVSLMRQLDDVTDQIVGSHTAETYTYCLTTNNDNAYLLGD